MKSKYRGMFKLLILIISSVFIFEHNALGITFNDDLEKVILDYNYYDGIDEDKILHNIKDNSWNILKADGSFIKLSDNYIDYAGVQKSLNLNSSDDYYSFEIENNIGTTSFAYVDRNGTEYNVKGYSSLYPTINSRYFKVINLDEKENNLNGLYDMHNEKEIIPPIYDYLLFYNEDRISVGKDGKYGVFGLINIAEEIIIPFDYKNLQYINDNFIIAQNKDGKSGVINIENEIVIPFEYDQIWSYTLQNNYCNICKDNKWGLIDTNSTKIIIPIEYDDIMYAMDDLILAKKNGKSGIINLKNNVIAPFVYENIINDVNSFIVYKNEFIGILDKKGREILQPQYVDISEIKDEFITIAKINRNDEKKFAVYDYNGNELVPPIYDYIDYDASDKYMVVRNGWTANLVDKTTGEEVLKHSIFSDVKYINEKYLAGGFGFTNTNYCIINFEGQILTPDIYNDDIKLINVDGQDIIMAQLISNDEKLPRKFDYFKQTKGPSKWAVEDVSKSIENKLVPDYLQSSYSFNIKRKEFCSLIVSFLEKKMNTTRGQIIYDNNIYTQESPFTDVYNEEILICYYLGIIKGKGDGMFDANSDITREEAAVILSNLTKYLEIDVETAVVQINDKLEISSWAKNSVNNILQYNIMNGTGNNMFSPKKNLTREQAFIIMYRLFDNSNYKINDIK